MNNKNPYYLTIAVTGIIAAAVALMFVLVPPIAQDESYHAFADTRALLGIANFWNVVSNLPFALVGILGLWNVRGATARVLFGGVLLTCFGSAYYHWAPSDARLVWDRLPMTLVFMSFLTLIVVEKEWRHVERWLLWLFVFCGIASIVWWQMTGDLRPYVLVQFGPIVVILPILWKSKSRKAICAILTLYVLAKCAEHFDSSIYLLLSISGHTLKHIVAASATYCILRWRTELQDC